MFHSIPHHSLIFAVSVIALLIVATFVRFILQQRTPHADYQELTQRIQSWWWMAAILLGVLLFNKTLAIIFFSFLSVLILKEYLSIVPTRQTDRRVIFWAYFAIPVQYYFIYMHWYESFIIFVPVYLFLILPLRMVLIGETHHFLRSIGILHWGTMLSIFCIGHMAYLLQLPVKNPDAGYMGPVLYLIFMTQFNDVTQYVWGKLLGKHQIMPTVSPKKTWEGFIGGLLTVTLCSTFIAPLMCSLLWWQGTLVGALIGMTGFIGDVVISSIKRDLDIKDCSTLIPGHGGILDRVDSLLYTAPIFFHVLRYYG